MHLLSAELLIEKKHDIHINALYAVYASVCVCSRRKHDAKMYIFPTLMLSQQLCRRWLCIYKHKQNERPNRIRSASAASKKTISIKPSSHEQKLSICPHITTKSFLHFSSTLLSSKKAYHNSQLPKAHILIVTRGTSQKCMHILRLLVFPKI